MAAMSGRSVAILLAIVCLASLGAYPVAASPSEAASPTSAASCATCLGPITSLGRGNDVLSGFHKTSVTLQQFGRPELLLLVQKPQGPNPLLAGGDATEMWPVVKALDQFGSWSHLRSVDKTCRQMTMPPFGTTNACTTPTFDASHSTYKSRYVRFALRYLLSPKRATKYSIGPGFTAARALAVRSLPPSCAPKVLPQ